MSAFFHKANLYLRMRTRNWGYRLQRTPSPSKWVFIAGCYNSGTSLLHDILAKHPSVGAMPNEGQFFTDQLMTGAKAGVRRLWAMKPELFRMDEKDNSINIDKLKKEWAYFYNDPSRPVLIEKTIANAARTRWLQKNFQPAYFICIFRNGNAVAEGIHRKEKHAVETAITQWKISNQILLEDMQHLHNKLMLTYEELAGSPEQTLQKITDFLGLSPLHESVFTNSFRVHELESQIRNMNDESFRRLDSEKIKVINHLAGDMLDQLGYPRLSD